MDSARRVEDAIEAVARGEIVVVVGAGDARDGGDLVMAADRADEERMAFFVRHTSGLVCAAVTGHRADALHLRLPVAESPGTQGPATPVMVDYRHGRLPGISARDRAATARALADPDTRSTDLVHPGHLQVARSRKGGVLHHPGRVEAAVDLARAAGRAPVALLSRVVTEDSRGMADRSELERFAWDQGLLLVTVRDLVRYRRARERSVRRAAAARLPTEWGEFTCYAYESTIDDQTHLAFTMGDVSSADEVLVRLHRECLSGDVFHSLRCGCGDRLRVAMREVSEQGAGVVVYLRGREGRGAGLSHVPVARRCLSEAPSPPPGRLTDHAAALEGEDLTSAQILEDLGVDGRAVRRATEGPRVG
jgi:3,4-dihydroxy 2-butanone 4-phosphate synthase / GTP cyclohydrolase II